MPALTSFPGLTQTQINALIAAYAAPLSHNHAASAITSGLLALARGGTAADLAATGGATHFLRQASVGAALTVGGIVSADLTTALTTPPAIGGTTPSTLLATGITMSKDSTERLTNGSFAGNATGWTLGTGWAYSSNNVVHTVGQTGLLTQAVGAVAGDTYIVVFTISNRTAGGVAVRLGNTYDFTNTYTTNATFTVLFHATSTGVFEIIPESAFDGAISAVSVKKIAALTAPQVGDGINWKLRFNLNGSVDLRNAGDSAFVSLTGSGFVAGANIMHHGGFITNAAGLYVTSWNGAAKVLYLTSGSGIAWSAVSTLNGSGDIGIARNAANVLEINTSTINTLAALLASAATFRQLTANTSTVSTGLTIGHNTSGVPLAGFGSGLAFTLKSSTTNDRASGYIRSLWNDPANVAAIADLVLISAHNANGTVTEREGLRIRGGVSATQLGFFGATPIAKPALGTWAGLTTDQKLDAMRDALSNLGLASYA